MGWLTALRGRSAHRTGTWRQHAVRVAEQTLDRARAAGRRTAARILRVQQAAGLNRKLAEQSVQSVRSRQHDRAADRAFRDAYVARAEAALGRQPLSAPVAEPDPEPVVNSGAIPSGQHVTRHKGPRLSRCAPETPKPGLDKEAGQ